MLKMSKFCDETHAILTCSNRYSDQAQLHVQDFMFVSGNYFGKILCHSPTMPDDLNALASSVVTSSRIIRYYISLPPLVSSK